MKVLLHLAGLFGAISVAAFVVWTRPSVQVSQIPEPTRPDVELIDPNKEIGLVGLNDQIHGTFTIVNNSTQTVKLSEPLKSTDITVITAI